LHNVFQNNADLGKGVPRPHVTHEAWELLFFFGGRAAGLACGLFTLQHPSEKNYLPDLPSTVPPFGWTGSGAPNMAWTGSVEANSSNCLWASPQRYFYTHYIRNQSTEQ
jgi:hypothetical protein